LKIDSTDFLIKWNYQTFETVGVLAGDEWKNKKIPAYLHQDPDDSSRMYLMGQYHQRASVVKFDKKQASVDWSLEIKSSNGEDPETEATTDMSEIYSYAQSKEEMD
jgi:hypothetical protein